MQEKLSIFNKAVVLVLTSSHLSGKQEKLMGNCEVSHPSLHPHQLTTRHSSHLQMDSSIFKLIQNSMKPGVLREKYMFHQLTSSQLPRTVKFVIRSPSIILDKIIICSQATSTASSDQRMTYSSNQST